jgi:hypothetical protein
LPKSAEYAILNRRLPLSLKCRNTFNAKELTNLNCPLPGRTATPKTRTTTLKWQ